MPNGSPDSGSRRSATCLCPPVHARLRHRSALPPSRPLLPGAVERSQSTWRYEFYACHDLPHRLDKLQPLVDAFAYRFNHHRPHQALGDLTPAEYLSTFSREEPQPSQMC